MLRIIETILFGIDWLLSRIAAMAILAVMALIVCDVFGRYMFGRPLPWVYDIVSIYVVNLVLYFLASEVLRTRSNIELDLHLRFLPQRLWSVLQGCAWLVVAMVLALAAWQVWSSMADSFATGEVHPGLYEWPVWAEKAVVALGLTLLACRILVRFCRFVECGLDASVFNADESARPIPGE
jgi:TRAP-type C4-dicarboxylate transport system permease small subunit